MTLERVSWHLTEGIRSFGHFQVMLEVVASFCNVSVKPSCSWEGLGLALDNKYWLGVHWDEPDHICFQTDKCRIDPDAARVRSVDSVIEKDNVPGGLIWRRSAELGSEEVHFYARSKVSQMQWLEGFLRECLAMARTIEMPDQPPIPDEPEGA